MKIVFIHANMKVCTQKLTFSTPCQDCNVHADECFLANYNFKKSHAQWNWSSVTPLPIADVDETPPVTIFNKLSA